MTFHKSRLLPLEAAASWMIDPLSIRLTPMRDVAKWQPTKFVFRGGELRASRDTGEIAVGSRLVGDLTAEAYGRAIVEHARGRLLDLACGKVPLFGVHRDHISDVQCVDWEPQASRSNLRPDAIDFLWRR
jgi:hypothetical protein